MFVYRYVPKTNHFIKLMVGFQFHFNRLNGVEKIDEKYDNIHPHALNEKIALFGPWTRPHVICGKTVAC